MRTAMITQKALNYKEPFTIFMHLHPLLLLMIMRKDLHLSVIVISYFSRIRSARRKHALLERL